MSIAPIDTGNSGTAGGVGNTGTAISSGGLLGIFHPTNNNVSLNGLLGVQLQVVNIAQTYGAPVSYTHSFFANANNQAATEEAVNVYGIPANYPGDSYRDHYGWCPAYAPINELYYLALMFSHYPRPQNSELNCRTLAGFIVALDQEKINADNKYAGDNEPCTHTAAIRAIGDIQGIYRSMYSGLSCDLVIQQQNQAATTVAAQAIADHAAQLQLEAQYSQAGIAMNAADHASRLQLEGNAANSANTQNIAGTGAKGTNTYLVGGIIVAALVLIVGSAFIFKRKSQQKQSS